VLGFSSETVKIGIVINIPLLIVGVIVVLVSTILSAAIPALRASKVSPIDLVRQSSDIKVKKNKVKGSRLLTKLFGAEGMLASKNYSRNRRKYRATIVSLSVSIILFIAASSFCSYLKGATDMEFNIGNTSLIFFNVRGDMDPIDNESEMKDLLSSAEDVRDVIGVKNIYSYQLINRDGEAVPEDFDVEAMED
jgi:putative ABC transport system permease protein